MTTTTADTAADRTARPGTGGPPLWLPALASLVLTVAGAALYAGPRPGAAPGTALALHQAGGLGAAVSTLLLFSSAAPLAVLAAAFHQRLQVLGVRVAGPTIGLAGGLLAAAAMAASGLVGATALAVAPAGDAGVAAALAQLSFLAGGPGFAVPFALLLAGVAVPCLVLGLLPRWVAVAGLVLAGLGVVAVLVLVLPALAPVLPVVRFGGLLWLIGVGVVLPRRRAAARRTG
ncbi:hypothetical protein Acsp06_42890 [Actinomycetospora sp. NBRC 106375]|uniref:DUF4386 domain-containing protein n=1 Tax=Actinomycetospora sp. NBRC 106375 TaxID=3032207 RepID=UPI0024A16D63|nr:DUF4386 domain-containing protein [Actinomycetospora sp. NBRC 106375]GLZ48104.1 hypothetical protein Acsp06_42890 [Actinomycetospora sp. NBRC 106375]